MATKEEVLQKVTDYCTEKQYTLNEDFRSQYSEKYAANYAEADVNNEAVLKDIKFHLDTALLLHLRRRRQRQNHGKPKKLNTRNRLTSSKKQNPPGT